MKVRRLVVAVDALRSSLQTLEAVAELAVSWRVEISGVFVEDANLLRWASLPFASEIEASSAAVRRREQQEVEQQLRSRAQYAQQVLGHVARHLSLPSSFKITRGSVPGELLTLLTQDDLLVVGKGRRSTAQDPDLGSTARVLVSRVRGRVLLVAQGSRVAGPVAVVYHASPSGQLALGTAMELVAGRERDLVILSLSGRDQVVESTADELSRRGLQIKTDVRIRDFVFTDVPHLLATVHAAGANVLVVPAGGQGVPGNVIEDLARRFLGHVLIVAGDLET